MLALCLSWALFEKQYCCNRPFWRTSLAKKREVRKTERRASRARAAPPRDADAREARDAGGLDRYDIALLGELQRDARQSNADLAARIGLSPAPTWRRVRRLEELGVITGYRAEIDRRKIGLGVLAFVRVDAERDNADATRALEEAIRGLPEVISCHYISGAGTFELQVLVTDLDAYSRWTMETLFRLPNVKDLHTSFSLGEIKAAPRCRSGTWGAPMTARRCAATDGLFPSTDERFAESIGTRALTNAPRARTTSGRRQRVVHRVGQALNRRDVIARMGAALAGLRARAWPAASPRRPTRC